MTTYVSRTCSGWSVPATDTACVTNRVPRMVFAAFDVTIPIDAAAAVVVVDDAAVVAPTWMTSWSGGRCDDACDDCVNRWGLIWRMHRCCCRCCGGQELRSSCDWTIVAVVDVGVVVVVVPAVILM